MEEESIFISKRYLKELIDFQSKKLVGKVLKRYEIVQDRNALKLEIKELIYENFRDFYDLLESYTKGYEISIYQFKNKTGTGECA